MKNGSASVVRSSAQDLKKYPSKPSVPSLVQQWQRKAVSLVEDAWQGAATALLTPCYIQQNAIAPNAVSKRIAQQK
jgi:hypothetical protein